MMYIAGSPDIIVWPQLIIGETFIKCHKGNEKLVVLDARRDFLELSNPGKKEERK
jgi:hypothetical protein